MELLAAVLAVDEKEGETEKVVEELVLQYDLSTDPLPDSFSSERKESALADWSGASGFVYREFDDSRQPPTRSDIFDLDDDPFF